MKGLRNLEFGELFREDVINCPRCGSKLSTVAIGEPQHNGTSLRTIVKCSDNCYPNERWIVAMEMGIARRNVS